MRKRSITLTLFVFGGICFWAGNLRGVNYVNSNSVLEKPKLLELDPVGSLQKTGAVFGQWSFEYFGPLVPHYCSLVGRVEHEDVIFMGRTFVRETDVEFSVGNGNISGPVIKEQLKEKISGWRGIGWEPVPMSAVMLNIAGYKIELKSYDENKTWEVSAFNSGFNFNANYLSVVTFAKNGVYETSDFDMDELRLAVKRMPKICL